MTSSILANIRRSWVHHSWLQLATLTVLVASYTVILAFLTFGQNLKSVLSLWGDSVQMTVYVDEELAPEKVDALGNSLKDLDGVETVKFISKKEAAEKFKLDMSGFMPEMVNDQDFSTPFPASFVIRFRDSVRQKVDSEQLGKIAKQIFAFEGTEDVSYGQEWVQKYASFVSGINVIGLVLILILLCGSIFVIGNAVKTAIFVRREEIEILELFGATKKYIRTPYIIDGAVLGFIAGVIAVMVTNTGISALRESIDMQSVFMAIKSQLNPLSFGVIFLFLLLGTAFGALSAYFFVGRLNHGWLAAKRNDF
jgi:cell division transport system permease protein